MRNKSKFILSLFLSFLLIFSSFAFAYAEDEPIVDTTQSQTEEVQVEEQKQEEPQTESVKEANEESEVVTNEQEEKTEVTQTETNPQEENTQEVQVQPQEDSNVDAPNKVETKVVNTTLKTTKKTLAKNTLTNNSTPSEIEIETAEEFNAIIAELNANGGSKTIKLKNNIALTGQNPQIKKGELTILGEGYTLEASLSVFGDGKLNLGADGYEKTLDMPPGRSDLCVINTDYNGELNIYNGVTIRDCTRYGQSGGILSVGNSVVNMFGGLITNCHSGAVSGGVYLDGHAVFNMHGGKITNCTGVNGGAVGLSGGSPFGPSIAGPVAFNMYGGTISNCIDSYYGGGAICSFSSYPATVNIYGGKIENCSANSSTGKYAYGGGGIYLFCWSDLTFNMQGGEIIGCDSTNSKYGLGGAVLVYTTGSASKINFTNGLITNNKGAYGGGIFMYRGNATIADGFGLHNNIAISGGDDIYNNGTNVVLGAACTTAVLTACNHLIDGWYEDAAARWSYTDCTGEEQHLEEFTDLGIVITNEYGLKAAHGLNPKEPSEPIDPDEPDKPDEPNNPVEPQESTKPSESIPTKIESTTTKTTTKVASTNNSVITTNTSIPTPKQQKTTTISEPKTPQAEPEQHWALINLILSILTAISGFIFIIRKKDKKHTNKRKVIAASVALISAIIFVLTENMTLPMAYTDKWTFLMIFPLIIEIVNIFVMRQESKGKENNG